MLNRTTVSLLWNISRKEIRTRPIRFALFVLALAIGFALPISTHVATDTVISNFNRRLDQTTGRIDLQIRYGSGDTGFPEQLIDVVREVPGVADAAAVLHGVASVVDPPRETVELVGVDLMQASIAELYQIDTLVRTADDVAIINDPRAVFVTSRFAAERTLTLGDHLRLATPTGTAEYVVRGLLTAGPVTDAYAGRIVVMYLPAAQNALGVAGDPTTSSISRIDVTLAEESEPRHVQERIEAALASGFTVFQPEQRRLSTRRLVSGLRATLLGISTFALLAAMFIVYSTVSALVTYRNSDLVRLTTVGVTPRNLTQLVLAEAAVLGFLGAILGVLAGNWIARLAVADVAAGMSLNYSLRFSATAPSWDVSVEALAYAPLGTLAAIVSAWLPARRLRHADTVSVQRSGVPEVSARALRTQLLCAAAICGVAGSLAMWIGYATHSPLWGSAGSTFVGTAAILVTLPPLHALWSALRSPPLRSASIGGWFVGELLSRNVLRTSATVAAISLSIAVALTAATLPHSFRKTVSHWYGFAGDLVLSSRSKQGGWLSAPFERSVAERLVELPEVERVDFMRVAPGTVFRGDRLTVVGASRAYVASALESASERSTDSCLTDVLAGGAAIVSRGMKLRYGIAPGTAVSIDAPTGVLKLPVVASIPDFVSDKGSILISYRLFERYWKDRLVNYAAIHGGEGKSATELRRAIDGALAADSTAFSLVSATAFRRSIDRAIDEAFADVDALQLLILAVTLAGIADLLISGVLDRRRVHASLLLAGASDRSLFALAAGEAAVIGLSASLVGALVGCLASWVWIRFTYPLLVGYLLDLHFEWGRAADCAMIVTVVAISVGLSAMVFELLGSLSDTVRVD